MASRQPSLDQSEAGPERGGLWLALFVLALAAFLGSLMILTDTVLDRSMHKRVPAALTDTGQAAEQKPAVVQGAGETGRTTSPIPEPTLQPARAAPSREDARLGRAIEHALGDDLPHTSAAVRRLSDGRTASVDGDREFYAASTFKLAVLYEAERRRSLGLLNLDDEIQISEEDLAEDLGTINDVPAEAGGGVRIRTALHAMITISDNASANALLHLLGGESIDRTLRELGLTHTSVNTHDLPTTAGDMAILMQAIVEGRGVSAEARDEMRGFLSAQLTRDGIPAGLPRGVPVGNKTGTWEGATHDIAFVDAPGGTYVIAILSDRGWEWAPIERVSAAVYEALATP